MKIKIIDVVKVTFLILVVVFNVLHFELTSCIVSFVLIVILYNLW